MSSDKEKVLAIAKGELSPDHPKDIIKDPMVLEFLGLKPQAEYYEKDLEQAIITNIQHFLLELGNGFSFVARQKRLLLEDDEYFADLVFYNRLLRCFVVIEIKTHKLSHQDIGQLQMYVHYYDRFEKQDDENPTIGILLCTDKNDTMVKLVLPDENNSKLMNLKTIPLSEENIQQIQDSFKTVYLLDKHMFMQLYVNDLLGESIPNTPNWLNQVFGPLNFEGQK